MARLAIEASPAELGLYRDQLDELVAALAEQGHDVQLRRPQETVERRGGLPDGFDELARFAIDLSI